MASSTSVPSSNQTSPSTSDDDLSELLRTQAFASVKASANVKRREVNGLQAPAKPAVVDQYEKAGTLKKSFLYLWPSTRAQVNEYRHAEQVVQSVASASYANLAVKLKSETERLVKLQEARSSATDIAEGLCRNMRAEAAAIESEQESSASEIYDCGLLLYTRSLANDISEVMRDIERGQDALGAARAGRDKIKLVATMARDHNFTRIKDRAVTSLEAVVSVQECDDDITRALENFLTSSKSSPEQAARTRNELQQRPAAVDRLKKLNSDFKAGSWPRATDDEGLRNAQKEDCTLASRGADKVLSRAKIVRLSITLCHQIRHLPEHSYSVTTLKERTLKELADTQSRLEDVRRASPHKLIDIAHERLQRTKFHLETTLRSLENETEQMSLALDEDAPILAGERQRNDSVVENVQRDVHRLLRARRPDLDHAGLLLNKLKALLRNNFTGTAEAWGGDWDRLQHVYRISLSKGAAQACRDAIARLEVYRLSRMATGWVQAGRAPAGARLAQLRRGEEIWENFADLRDRLFNYQEMENELNQPQADLWIALVRQRLEFDPRDVRHNFRDLGALDDVLNQIDNEAMEMPNTITPYIQSFIDEELAAKRAVMRAFLQLSGNARARAIDAFIGSEPGRRIMAYAATNPLRQYLENMRAAAASRLLVS